MEEWTRTHMLGIKALPREEIEAIFSLAKSFQEISTREVKKVPALRGKTLINLFFENSTRTRTSFELAAKRLSADVVNFSASSSSLAKGETIIDTVKNLEAYHPDIFVIRVGSSAALYALTQHTEASIVNAGDGRNEHPTQALLDMFTVSQQLGSCEKLKVLIVGDILHSRVARSNMFGFRKFASQIILCGPPSLVPFDCAEEGIRVEYDLDAAVESADVIIMLRVQQERQTSAFFPSLREYSKNYALTPRRLARARKDALVLHPGPVNWDVEIHSSLKWRVHPLILKQAENGLAVRMAVLFSVGTKKRTL
ncbi:MAG: aspartate carbamoyltransferase catalytic subunit [Candidatus Omnitrophica bacterium]|nr:aspartate carbamoyltransferase catalytic subunit [Candidatus Omnitrophota bacterium]